MPHRSTDISRQESLDYWKAAVAGMKPCLLMSESPDLDGSHPGQAAAVTTPFPLSTLLEFCAQHDLQAISLIETAWAVVISCYTGTEDVSYGYVAGDRIGSSRARPHASVLRRETINPETPLKHALIRMASSFQESIKHCQCSFTDLEEMAGATKRPLFDSWLSVALPEQVSSELYQTRGMPNGKNQKYSVMATVMTDDQNRLSVSILAATTSPDYAANIAHTFSSTLSQFLAKDNLSRTVGQLDLISKRDADHIQALNGSLPPPVERCFHHLFEELAHQQPDAPAICSWDGKFSYGQLQHLSTKLAHTLVSLGVVPEAMVPICFDKSAFAIICMLAILKAGGAFVALDPNHPPQRIDAILQATKATVVLSAPSYAAVFDARELVVLSIERSYLDQLPTDPKPVPIPTMPLNAAYVVFTSGSTGTPKGIIVSHQALCTSVLGLAAPMRVLPTSRVLQFAAYTFDVSVGDIFVAIGQGACVCVPSEHEKLNDLAGAITRLNVDTACLVPSVARCLHPQDVSTLQTLSLGGEALLQENLETWAPHVSLINVYGPAECTIWCSTMPNLSPTSAANNIGSGQNALLWLVNQNNPHALAPFGTIGEILVEGPVLARSYLDAEQTQRAFVAELAWAAPRRPDTPRRFYKTGDLGRYNPDGTVSFIGRKDTQIKLHGRRIETGEIEHHLAAHAQIHQAIVLVPKAGAYAQRLVAVVALALEGAKTLPGEDLRRVHELPEGTLADVKAHLAANLPSYMTPHFWIRVAGIPLMTSGKMNRVLVRDFVEAQLRHDSKAMGAAAQVAVEKHDQSAVKNLIQRNWGEVLSLEPTQMSLNESFSSLGGDSFAAMDFVARCKAEGFVVSLEDLTGNVTLRELTTILTARLNIEEKSLSETNDVVSKRVKSTSLWPVWWDAVPSNGRIRV